VAFQWTNVTACVLNLQRKPQIQSNLSKIPSLKQSHFTWAGWSETSAWHQYQACRAWLVCTWCWTLPGSDQSSRAAKNVWNNCYTVIITLLLWLRQFLTIKINSTNNHKFSLYTISASSVPCKPPLARTTFCEQDRSQRDSTTWWINWVSTVQNESLVFTNFKLYLAKVYY